MFYELLFLILTPGGRVTTVLYGTYYTEQQCKEATKPLDHYKESKIITWYCNPVEPR